MVHPALIAVASLPLIFRLAPTVLPDRWLEPYTYWSAASLNTRRGEDGPRSQWRNMGWWKVGLSISGSKADTMNQKQETDVFPDAAEALAERLITFANAEPGGRVFGKSTTVLLHKLTRLEISVMARASPSVSKMSGTAACLCGPALHLATSPPVRLLSALTSLPSETLASKALVVERFPNTTTKIEWYTGSATYRPGKDLEHPLNPMRGFLGKRDTAQRNLNGDDADDDDHVGDHDGDMLLVPQGSFDLIYILDAIYHFPPSVPYFLATILPSLKPGSGVLAYTDILPPPDLNAAMGHLVLPLVLGVPSRNLVQRPRDLGGYQRNLEKIGFVDVEVEDWSDGVWEGFGKNLRDRGGAWGLVGRGIQAAHRGGWKFIAVKGRRPTIPG